MLPATTRSAPKRQRNFESSPGLGTTPGFRSISSARASVCSSGTIRNPLRRDESTQEQPTSFPLNCLKSVTHLSRFLLGRQVFMDGFQLRELGDFDVEAEGQNCHKGAFIEIH